MLQTVLYLLMACWHHLNIAVFKTLILLNSYLIIHAPFIYIIIFCFLGAMPVYV